MLTLSLPGLVGVKMYLLFELGDSADLAHPICVKKPNTSVSEYASRLSCLQLLPARRKGNSYQTWGWCSDIALSQYIETWT